MTQAEKRLYLIKALLSERRCYDDTLIPGKAEEQKRLLRSLMNIRAPEKTNEDFIRIQDEYLRAETAAKGITDLCRYLMAFTFGREILLLLNATLS